MGAGGKTVKMEKWKIYGKPRINEDLVSFP